MSCKSMSVTPLRSPSTISGLVGWFTGFSAEMNASNELTRWRDLSGKGNHVESSAMRSGSINTSTPTNASVYTDATRILPRVGVVPFPFLYGSTDAGLQFPTTMMSDTSNYTLFHVARYYKPGDAVPTRKRIFDGVTPIWLSGFWRGRSGVAFHGDGRQLTSEIDIHGDNWVLTTDQKNMYRSNGTNRTLSYYSGGSSRQLSINHGSSTNEYSDWACAEVIVYDRELTSTEYEAVEAYLNAKYFSTNLEIPSTGPISTMSFATYLHDGTGYPISLRSLGSNLGLTSSISFSDFRGGAQIPRVSPVKVFSSDLRTQVITVRGPSFTSTPSIKVVGVDGTEYNVSSTTYVSQGVATFTLGTLSLGDLANQPFKVKIGSATSIDTISTPYSYTGGQDMWLAAGNTLSRSIDYGYVLSYSSDGPSYVVNPAGAGSLAQFYGNGWIGIYDTDLAQWVQWSIVDQTNNPNKYGPINLVKVFRINTGNVSGSWYVDALP